MKLDTRIRENEVRLKDSRLLSEKSKLQKGMCIMISCPD